MIIVDFLTDYIERMDTTIRLKLLELGTMGSTLTEKCEALSLLLPEIHQPTVFLSIFNYFRKF